MRYGILSFIIMIQCLDVNAQTNVPTGRNQMAAAFDSDKHVLLIFGGEKHHLDRKDTLNRRDNRLWSFDGKTWKILASNGPSWREDAKMVYHSKYKKAYLIGGRSYFDESEAIIHDEMWEWNGTQWTEIRSAHTPGKTLHTNVVYDPARNRIVMFGGAKTEKKDGSPFVSDVWEWDGSDWILMPTNDGPSPRIAHSMTYSPALKRTLIIGGVSLDGTVNTDLWAWDGTDFELLDSNVPRIELGPGNAVSIDTSKDVKLFLTGRPIEFGEVKNVMGSQRYNFSWLWNGKRWNEMQASAGPPLRETHVVCHDSYRGRVMVFGGNARAEKNFETFNDVWAFDNGKWKKM